MTTKSDTRGELDALKREAVEWYKNRFDRSDIIEMPSDREVLFDFIDHLAQRGLIVKEGWVAVPREPTEEMCRAAIDRPGCPGDAFMYEGIYRAMIAAAPEFKEEKS